LKSYLKQVKVIIKDNIIANSNLIIKLLNIIVIINKVSSNNMKSVIINAVKS